MFLLLSYDFNKMCFLNQHKMRMHEAVSGVSVPRHVCDICGKTFKVKPKPGGLDVETNRDRDRERP